MATKNESGTLEPGDILLGHRRAHTGPSDWLTASVIEKVQGTHYGHAAMYVGGGQVVHAHRALPKAGVTTFPLKEFKDLYDYKAYRVKADSEVRKDAVRFVRSALGRGFSLTDLVGSLVSRKAGGDEHKKRMEARLKPEFICSTLIAAAYPSHVFAKQSLESTKPVDLSKSNHTKLVAEFKKLAVAYQKKIAMKTVDFQGMKIRLDRPKGFVQTGKSKTGKPWARTYLFDYGFIPKTQGGDGDGVDVFIGPDKTDQESYWAIQKKDDGSFDEYKVFLGFGSLAAAKKAYTDHIPAKYLKGMVTIRTNMMKALLGLDPVEKLAAINALEFLGGLHAA